MTEPRVGPTVESARRSLTARFKAGRLDSAELDARILVGAVLKLDLTGLIVAAHRPLAPDEQARLENYARRRLAAEPIARILGVKEFWGLALQLSAATLVPRADTETVVELALESLQGKPDREARLRIADIGTGTGAILLALLSELPRAHGIGTDLSLAAVQTARGNAARLGFAERADFVVSDYTAALSGPLDLIVCNPPYIRSADIADLAPEVRNHDPRLALDGGVDGMVGYRRLIPRAALLLKNGGSLVVETGQGQSGDIEELMTSAGLTLDGPAKPDLAGVRRAVAGRKLPR